MYLLKVSYMYHLPDMIHSQTFFITIAFINTQVRTRYALWPHSVYEFLEYELPSFSERADSPSLPEHPAVHPAEHQRRAVPG